MLRQTLENKTYRLISVLSSNLPQQRALWHHSSHTESLNTRPGCGFFQSSEERFNCVIPVHAPNALTGPTTSPATPTSLDILHLKWLTFNHLLRKQKLLSDHKQIKTVCEANKKKDMSSKKLFYKRQRDPYPVQRTQKEKTMEDSLKGARNRMRYLNLSAHTQPSLSLLLK